MSQNTIGWVQAIILGVQTVVFVIQTIVFWYQAKMLRRTVDAAAKQSLAMDDSITQLTRAADAMKAFSESAAIASTAATESVATTKDTMTRLLRAYVCVNYGAAIFQVPATGYKFEVRLPVINAGQTPAYKVGFKVRADVLPFPLPQNFDFTLPDNPASSESTLGGHAPPMTLTGVVDRLYDEEEVAEIRSGSKRLYIFGTVTYEDVYGLSRSANFCFGVNWLKDTTMGIYTRRHNDSD